MIIQSFPVTEPDSLSWLEPHVALRGADVYVVAFRFHPDSNPGSGLLAMPGRFECRAFQSDNIGETWSESVFPELGACADPWVTRTASGVAYLSVGSNASGESGLVFLLREGGSAWTELLRVTGVFDRPTVRAVGDTLIAVVSGMSGPAEAIVLSPAPDGGTRVQRSALGAKEVNQSSNGSAVLQDGSVLALYTDYDTTFVRRSADMGRTWGAPVVVTDLCENEVQQTAASGSQVFVVCLGEGDALLLYASSDAGATWSRRWSSDASKKRGTPGVARWGASGLGVVWQEVLPDGCRGLMALLSQDGVNFAEPRRIDAGPSCPDSAGPGVSAANAAGREFVRKRFPFGGDYMGVDGDERALVVVWPVSDRGGAYGLELVRVWLGRG